MKNENFKLKLSFFFLIVFTAFCQLIPFVALAQADKVPLPDGIIDSRTKTDGINLVKNFQQSTGATKLAGTISFELIKYLQAKYPDANSMTIYLSKDNDGTIVGKGQYFYFIAPAVLNGSDVKSVSGATTTSPLYIPTTYCPPDCGLINSNDLAK